MCVRGWKWHPWSRSSQGCVPCTAPGCCQSCYFLPKDRLSWDDDPVVRADAGILCEAQRCRLRAGIPSCLQKSYQSPGGGECAGNGVSAVWDVVHGIPGTSFPGVFFAQPGQWNCDSHTGLAPGAGGWAREQEEFEHLKGNFRTGCVGQDCWRSRNPPSLEHIPRDPVQVGPGKGMHVPSKGHCGWLCTECSSPRELPGLLQAKPQHLIGSCSLSVCSKCHGR